MNNKLNVLPPGTELLNGKRKYRVEEVLGTGGFGITYKVSSVVMVDHVPVNTFFAMKEYFLDACYRGNDHTTMLFSSTLAADIEQSLGDFMTEARRLYSFADKSEHIVKVNEVFRENGTAYYIMEYLEGGNLHEYVQKKGVLSEKEALSFLTPIAQAVELLHKNRILHLDIKPENIMLKNDHLSGQSHPVLIDFGLVKHFDAQGKPTTRLSAKGASDGYAPMEQYTTIDKFSPTLDVYALGATLYYLLKGENPPKAFYIPSSADLVQSLPTAVSEPTRRAIACAMERNLYERTPTVKKFLSDLSFVDTKPENNHPTGSATTVSLDHGNFLSRKKKWTVIFFIALFAIVGGILWGICDGSHQFKEDGADGGDTLSAMTPLDEILKRDEPGKSIFTVKGVSFTMIKVKGGTFTMGATDEQGNDMYENEKPVCAVTLSDYAIGETEVTQELWQAVMGRNPSNHKGDACLPVEMVSWEQCQVFIAKLDSLTGQQFKLPTEAQWEYAARGGSESLGCKYSGSNYIQKVAWYWQNSGDTCLSGTDTDWTSAVIKANHCQTHPVGSLSPNELGLYDMSGNVWEWCQDWYGSYSGGIQTNPTGASAGAKRVFRGGCWDYYARDCRVSRRAFEVPSFQHYGLGLRLAL